jgi:hypothetical protein
MVVLVKRVDADGKSQVVHTYLGDECVVILTNRKGGYGDESDLRIAHWPALDSRIVLTNHYFVLMYCIHPGLTADLKEAVLYSLTPYTTPRYSVRIRPNQRQPY